MLLYRHHIFQVYTGKPVLSKKISKETFEENGSFFSFYNATHTSNKYHH